MELVALILMVIALVLFVALHFGVSRKYITLPAALGFAFAALSAQLIIQTDWFWVIR